MRDLVLFAALLLLIPLIATAPFVGVLTWLWVSLMNPQREVFSMLNDFQLNLYVAAFTVVAWLLSRERKLPPADGFVLMLVLFSVWASICTYNALDPATAQPLWERTMKTVFLALAIATLARTQFRIQAVVWMLVASLGFYAVKGGGFVLMTGGSHQVFGPEDSMIADNNALGLVLVVTLPMMAYLFATSRSAVTRTALAGTLGLTLIAILGTYSRGALVALAALIVVQAFRSRLGLVVLVAGAMAAAALPAIAPAGWLQRMATFGALDQDASFQGRRAAWATSLNIAKARPLIGGGFSAVERNEVARAFKSPGSLEAGKAAHSIYFQVLGDTGFIGLFLYMAMLAAAGVNTMLVLWSARNRPDLAWARLLSRMLQCGLVAIMVGGAALSMAYYDGFLVMLALTTCLREVVRRQPRADPAALRAPKVPDWRRSPPAAPVPAARNTARWLSFERAHPPPDA